MANKQDIINAINTIDNGGLNTAHEVRSVLNDFLNGFYGDVITETHNSTNVITQSNLQFHYSVQINKVGRLVFLKGYFTSKGLFPANKEIFSIVNSDYNAIDLGLTPFFESYQFCNINTSNKLVTKIPTLLNESFEINLIYNTVN